MRSRWAILILLLAGIVSYANTAGNGLFWDDDEFITRNAYVRSFRFIPQWFTTPITAGAGVNSNYYRPLLTASFSLDYRLWGLWPAGYHLENMLWHTAAAILLFIFLSVILSDAPAGGESKDLASEASDPRKNGVAAHTIAFAASLLWLVHPAHVEAVAYANSRGDSMATVFILLSLILWMRKRIGGSAITFILALLSKEFAIVTPGLILLVDFVRNSSFRVSEAHREIQHSDVNNIDNYLDDRRSFSIYIANLASKKLYRLLTIVGNLYNFIKPILSHITIAVIYLILRLTVLNFQNTLNFYGPNLIRSDLCTVQRSDLCTPIKLYATSLKVRMLTFLKVLPIYAGILVWPTDLHMERTAKIATTVADKTVILTAAVIVVILLSCYLAIRKKQILPIFSVGWFFISILPVSGLIPISQILAEHFLYLPSIGFFLIVAWMIVHLTTSSFRANPPDGGGVEKSSVAISISPSARSLDAACPERSRRARDDENEKRFSHFLPLIIVFIFVVPLLLKTIRQNTVWHDPILFYEYTLAHAQPTARVYNNLAMAYADAKDYQKAMNNYQLAISLGDVYPNPHYNLGNTFLEMGNVEEAEKEYRRALEIDPNFHFATLKLGQLYLDQGKTEEAVNLVCPAFPEQPLCRQGSRP